MPTLNRLCEYPGCGHTSVRGSRYCLPHKAGSIAQAQQRDRDRGSPTRRGYGAAWRAIRASYLRRYPRCEDCGAPATEVDHITPLSRGGTHSESNLSAKCKPCHSRKTINEFRDEISPT